MLLMQIDALTDQGAKIIEKSYSVSENPAITLLVAWQSFVILILIIAVIWLVRDKAKTTKEFVQILTEVNNGIDKLADSIKDGDGNIGLHLRDLEQRVVQSIKENLDHVKESIRTLNK